jgi:hypothetical protein
MYDEPGKGVSTSLLGGIVTDSSVSEDADWELFTHRRARPPEKQPLVTIQSRGNMSLNGPAYEELGEPETVELLYSERRNAIGIRPASDPAADYVYRLRRAAGKSTYVLSLLAFAQYYGIPIKTTTSRRYAAEAQNGMLVVDLNQTPLEIESPRYGKPVPSRRKQEGEGKPIE